MNILVIGGSGFIGPYIVSELLRAGHRVTIFHRGNAQKQAGAAQMMGDRNDLGRHRQAFQQNQFDVVVDLLLSSESQAQQLIETFRGVTGRIVAVSSMDVYRAWGVFYRTEPGELQELPVHEDSELRTRGIAYPPEVLKKVQEIFPWMNDEYEKIKVEKAVMTNPEIPGTVVRLPMVYGPGDPLHRFHFLLRRIADGRKNILFAEDVAAMHTPRGYVENVAHAICLAATFQRASGRIYNVCEPTSLSELEWAKKIAKLAHWDGDLIVLPHDQAPKHLRMPGNTAQHLVASSDRIRRELEYQEQVSPDEGMRRTMHWEADHPPQKPMAVFDYPAEDEALRQRKAAS